MSYMTQHDVNSRNTENTDLLLNFIVVVVTVTGDGPPKSM